jgi:hypothetical protein
LPGIKVYCPAVFGLRRGGPSRRLTEEVGELIQVDQEEETMKRIRLKYPITDFGETLYEVGLQVSHEEETSIVKQPQKSIRKPSAASEAQIAHRECFKLAVAYARSAIDDPQVCIHYEEMARQQGKRPWDAAVSDYLSGNDLLARK